MNIKGAIFDMDGTLLDTMIVWRTLGSRFVAACGATAEEELDTKLNQMAYPKNREYLQEHYCPDKTLEEIEQGMLQCMVDFYRNEAEPLAYVKTMLQAMKEKGIKMCVASATPKWMCELALERAGLRDYFSAIFDVDSVGKSKNHPDIFEQALAFLGTAKEETAIFEDAHYSIKTCKAAGFPVVAVNDNQEAKQAEIRALADVYLYSYAEWPKIFNTVC